MTATILDIEPIEVLDFDPAIPCDHKQHQWFSPNDLPAAWAYYWRCPFPCGCRPYAPVEMFCNDCHKVLTDTANRTIACLQCQAPILRLSDYALRIETLKK